MHPSPERVTAETFLVSDTQEAMVKYTTGMVLVITTGVLGGLVCVMGLIYTYIYCTRMKPRTR